MFQLKDMVEVVADCKSKGTNGEVMGFNRESGLVLVNGHWYSEKSLKAVEEQAEEQEEIKVGDHVIVNNEFHYNARGIVAAISDSVRFPYQVRILLESGARDGEYSFSRSEIRLDKEYYAEQNKPSEREHIFKDGDWVRVKPMEECKKLLGINNCNASVIATMDRMCGNIYQLSSANCKYCTLIDGDKHPMLENIFFEPAKAPIIINGKEYADEEAATAAVREAFHPWPQEGDEYLYLNECLEPIRENYNGEEFNKSLVKVGNFYRTLEEVNAARERVLKAYKGE